MANEASVIEIDDIDDSDGKGLGFFGRFLSLWVFLCIVIGVAIGQFIPAVPETLSRFTYAEVNIPIAILIWFMIYPMMVQIDFSSILDVRRQPKGLSLTVVVNWWIGASRRAPAPVYVVR